MKEKIIAIIIIVVVGAASFYAGTKTNNKTPSINFPQIGNQIKNGQGSVRQGFGGGTIGEIIAKDDTSITVKLDDGGSRIVLVSPTTTINKTTVGSLADLATGERVVIMGQANSDGSINAQSIQLGSGIQMFGKPTQKTPQ